MFLALPVLTSFILVFLLIVAGFKAVNLLFPLQPSAPKK